MKNIKFIKKDYLLILCISLFLSVAMSAFATQYDMSRYTILSPNNAVYYDLNVGNLYFDVGNSNIPTIEIGQRPAYRFSQEKITHFRWKRAVGCRSGYCAVLPKGDVKQ